jgi:hypothetical protein
MERRVFGFAAAAAVALALVATGCPGGGSGDGGNDDSGFDSGPDCVPSDAGYCGVCHVMTACGEYPPGPYGMLGPTTGPDGGAIPGQVLPPCFQGEGYWNPNGYWIYDGGNPQVASNESFFQDLYCSSKANPASTMGLIQVVITSDAFGRMQASAFTQFIHGPSENWSASGGQVMQIIEQSDMGAAPGTSDLVSWVQSYGTNYSIAADSNQVLLSLMDASRGWPVTYIRSEERRVGKEC